MNEHDNYHHKLTERLFRCKNAKEDARTEYDLGKISLNVLNNQLKDLDTQIGQIETELRMLSLTHGSTPLNRATSKVPTQIWDVFISSVPAKIRRALKSAFVVAIITGLFVLGAAFLASWLPPYLQAQQQNGTATAQAIGVVESATAMGMSVASLASSTVSTTPIMTRTPASATTPTSTPPPTLTPIPLTATNVPPTLTLIDSTANTLSPGTVRTDAAGITQIFVPKGCFLMGSDPAKDPQSQPDEKPQHKVCLNHDYWIDQYDVTNAAFDAFVKASGYSTDVFWSSGGLAWK